MIILRGWKSICLAAGGISKDTARNLMRKGAMPVKMIGGRPMTTEEVIYQWIHETCQGHNAMFSDFQRLAETIGDEK